MRKTTRTMIFVAFICVLSILMILGMSFTHNYLGN